MGNLRVYDTCKVFLALLALWVSSAAGTLAQTPTVVSGTATDVNGLPYSFAKVSATLNGCAPAGCTIVVGGIPVQVGGQVTGTADAGGNFSMNLYCNTAAGGCSVISPSGTTWTITVNENGAPPPLGTGPQECAASLTITNLTQSVSANFSGCPALAHGTSMSSLENVVSCLDVSPACVSDTAVLDGSTTAGSNLVTCPNPDCHFLTTAAVGHFIQGGTLAAGVVLPITTIVSVDSDTQVHVAANATGTGVGNVFLAWGPDNTASMDALSNASVKVCKYGFIPEGYYFTQHADFNSQPSGCNGAAGRVGGLIGAGPTWISTKLLMRYDFVYSGCNGGPSAKACFGGPIALDFRSVAIDMMFANPALGSLTYISECNACYFDRVGVSGAQGTVAATSNVVMMHFAGTEGVARESAAVGGLFACLNDGTATQLTLSPCIDAAEIGLFGNSGSFFSKGNFLNATGSTNCASLGTSCATYCATGAFCHHENDYFNGGTIANAGTAYYQHVFTNVGGTSSNLTNTSGGVMGVKDTTSPVTITNNAGGTFLDECGNNLSGGITNNGTWVGDCSVGSSFPAPQVAGNITPSTGWGTTGAAGNGVSAVSGLNIDEQFTITAAGTPSANPTIAIVFPHNFLTVPICQATQNGGTGAINPLTISTPATATGVAFKWNGTPVAGSTYQIAVHCGNGGS